MTKTKADVRPHPKTITEHSRKGSGKKQPRRPTSRPLITALRVDPQVLAVARKLAGGNIRRIEVRSFTCVVVKNHRVR